MTILRTEHIGWDLWQATQTWKKLYIREMQNLGYDWYAEARARLLQHINSNGIAQNELTERAGISKQAVQQQLDALVADGIIERASDPKDARRKLIYLTSAGVEILVKANAVKLELEREYEALIGESDMKILRKALNKIKYFDGSAP